MNFRKTIAIIGLMTLGMNAVASPDHNNVKKNTKKAEVDWVDELKKSIQFNYGVPLPKEITTAKKVTTGNADSYYNWLQKKYAQKMDVHPSEITNEALYRFINDWYGVRYVYGGTTKRGVDCSSFVQKVIKATLGIDLMRTAASQYVTTKNISRNELQEGDLVFFKIKVHRISHVGVYLQNNRFVHASSSRGVMISNLNSSYWSRYYAGGGRVKS